MGGGGSGEDRNDPRYVIRAMRCTPSNETYHTCAIVLAVGRKRREGLMLTRVCVYACVCVFTALCISMMSPASLTNMSNGGAIRDDRIEPASSGDEGLSFPTRHEHVSAGRREIIATTTTPRCEGLHGQYPPCGYLEAHRRK